MSRSKVQILGVLVVLGWSTVACASPITYIWTGTGTGRLGNNSFDGATFTIESQADTAGVFEASPGIFRVIPSISTISIQGLGTALFTVNIVNVLNTSLSRMGISDSGQDLAILFVDNDAFAAYDMTSPIGPLPGPAIINAGSTFGTTLGLLLFDDVSNATFEARVSAVPEPATIATSALGVIGLVVARRRRTRRQAA